VSALLELAAARDAQVLAVRPRPLGEGTGRDDEAAPSCACGARCSGRETQSGDYVGVMALGPVSSRLPERGCLFGDVALLS